jgi:hypothetical protein
VNEKKEMETNIKMFNALRFSIRIFIFYILLLWESPFLLVLVNRKNSFRERENRTRDYFISQANGV